jgi:hypothetical protein
LPHVKKNNNTTTQEKAWPEYVGTLGKCDMGDILYSYIIAGITEKLNCMTVSKIKSVIADFSYKPEDFRGLNDARGSLAELNDSIDDVVEQICAAKKKETEKNLNLLFVAKTGSGIS